jgi:uncharacterized protein YbaA (DUF1428 family)
MSLKYDNTARQSRMSAPGRPKGEYRSAQHEGSPMTSEDFMQYVDGFVIPVPEAKKEEYRALAETASVVFKDHGALSVVECWGDDVPEGKLTSFSMAVQRKPDEAVVFSWITWPSKEVRNSGMAKVMQDPRMNYDPNNMPFDGKRMIFGGFTVLVKA